MPSKVDVIPGLGALKDFIKDPIKDFLLTLGKKSGTPPVEEFSPSLKAAEALKQEKGPYEQLKATMINKHGAKEAEMNWSGTNDRFAGKTVTKTELVDYLSGNTDLIKADTNVAKGKMGEIENTSEFKELQRKATEAEILGSVAYDKNEWEQIWPEYNEDSIPEHYKKIKTIKYLQDNFMVQPDEKIKWGGVEDLVLSAKGQNPYRYYGDDFVGENKFINSSKRMLNQLAKSKNMSVDEFVKEYPKGYFARDISEKSQFVITKNEKEAQDIDWEILEPLEIKDQTEYFDQYEYPPTDLEELKKFGTLPETVSPDALTYTSDNFPLGGTDTAETVYRFDDPTGLYNDVVGEDIPHKFNELPEDNILAHTRTAQFPVIDGGKGHHLGEIQSDIYQNQRRLTKLGRIPEEELRSRSEELALREKLGSIDEKTLTSEIVSLEDKSDKMFDDIIANLRTKVGVNADKKWDIPSLQDEVYTLKLELAEKQRQLGDIKPLETINNQVQNALDELEGDINNYYIQRNKSDDLYNLQDKLEVYNMENKTDQFKQLPYGESTNQWVDMVLRKELAKAIDSGSEFMTIPSSDLVRKYTSGLEEGQGKFYFTESELGIVPKRLNKLAKKYDPNISLIPRQIITEAGDENVMALPLTQKLIDNIMNKGLPKYAVPITGGSLGALSFVEGEQQ